MVSGCLEAEPGLRKPFVLWAIRAATEWALLSNTLQASLCISVGNVLLAIESHCVANLDSGAGDTGFLFWGEGKTLWSFWTLPLHASACFVMLLPSGGETLLPSRAGPSGQGHVQYLSLHLQRWHISIYLLTRLSSWEKLFPGRVCPRAWVPGGRHVEPVLSDVERDRVQLVLRLEADGPARFSLRHPPQTHAHLWQWK